jgi:hypothetical protein
VLVATYTHRGQWPPSYERWSASTVEPSQNRRICAANGPGSA